MVMHPKLILVPAITIMLLGLSTLFITTAFKVEKRVVIERKVIKVSEDIYAKQAIKLLDYQYNKNIAIKFDTIKSLLILIDKHMNIIELTPYTRADILAIAFTETNNLNQYSVGDFGEIGIFQIRSSWFKGIDKKDHFDMELNVKLAMKILKIKYFHHKNYVEGIVAYNGLNRDSKGRINYSYFKRFARYKRDMDIVFREKKKHVN